MVSTNVQRSGRTHLLLSLLHRRLIWIWTVKTCRHSAWCLFYNPFLPLYWLDWLGLQFLSWLELS